MVCQPFENWATLTEHTRNEYINYNDNSLVYNDKYNCNSVYCLAHSHGSKAIGSWEEEGGGVRTEGSLIGVESELAFIHSLSCESRMQCVFTY